MLHRYVIALGSNVPHPKWGRPSHVLAAAFLELGQLGDVVESSAIITSAPIGPSRRRYANAAAVIETAIDPHAFLRRLKIIERSFGTRRGGRWRARVLDLDIILWDGGIWAGPELSIPHPAFRHRGFVLGPASSIAPAWRDPITSLSLRQLNARLTKPRPIPR